MELQGTGSVIGMVHKKVGFPWRSKASVLLLWIQYVSAKSNFYIRSVIRPNAHESW